MHEQTFTLAMCDDMQIHPYVGEDSAEYYSRLTYSGLAEWIKTVAYDDCIENNLEGKSKQYITRKVQKILDVYVEALPEIKSWYYPPEKTIEPIKEIRERLSRSGSLVSNKNNTLQYPLPKCTKISESLYLYRGYMGKRPERVIGLGTYVTQKGDIHEVSFSEMFNLPTEPANVFVDEYLAFIRDNFTQSIRHPESRSFFQCNSTRPISESWGRSFREDDEVTIYKDGLDDYGIVKRTDGDTYTVSFPSSYIEKREYRRFAYGLWYKSGNAAKVKIQKHGTLCTIRLPSHLPEKEQAALYQLAWSKRDIMDKTMYVAPIEVLPIIEKMFKNLCMDVIYQ